MKLLVTGATGFVGRNLVRRASLHGWKVLAPIRDPKKLENLLSADAIEEGVVEPLPADPEQWPDSLSVDAAVLAAGALFERYLDDFLATNVDWTMKVLSKLPHHCPTVVLSSQSAGGPTPPGLEARKELCADEPISHYGESKLRMERAIRRTFPFRPIALLRPPMILGPRDNAALQLFHMARGLLRTKPGFRSKSFSFIDVEDLLDAVEATLHSIQAVLGPAHYVAARRTFTDWNLISTVAGTMGRKGITVPLPHALVRFVASSVDASPRLRSQLPSLTRDRVKEIWPNRWVVDPTKFENATGWTAKTSLAKSLDAARAHYQEKGLL